MFLTKFAEPLANFCCATSNQVEQRRSVWSQNVIAALLCLHSHLLENNLNKCKGWSKTAGLWTHLTVINRWTERWSWSPRGHPVGVGRFYIEFQPVSAEKERECCITPSDGNENKRSAWGHCCHAVCVCVCVCVCVMKLSVYIRCVLAVSQWSLGAQDVYVCVYCQQWCIDSCEDLITPRSREEEKKNNINISIKSSSHFSPFLRLSCEVEETQLKGFPVKVDESPHCLCFSCVITS